MRGRWRLLGQWWFLAAAVTLAVNDHVLKARFPGWWTGKLSDFVGPVVVATVLAVFIGRTPAVVAVAAGFVALKTVPGVAELVAPVLGGVTLRDATDLVGLVALVPAWRLMGGARESADQVMGVRSPSPEWQVAVVRQRSMAVLGAALALVVTTATSPNEEDRVETIQLVDSTLYVEVVEAYSYDDPPLFAESTDGGFTWRRSDRTDLPTRDVVERDWAACRSDGWCFEITQGEILERAPGGEWRTSFALDGNERDMLEYRADTSLSLGGLAVAPVGEVEHVAAVAREEGVVVLDSDGTWHRVGVLDVTPTDLSGVLWPLRGVAQLIWIAPLLALLAALICTPGRSSGLSAWQRFSTFTLLMAVSGFLMVAALYAWFIGVQDRSDPVILAVIMLTLMVASVGSPFLLMRSGRPPVRRVRRPGRLSA